MSNMRFFLGGVRVCTCGGAGGDGGGGGAAPLGHSLQPVGSTIDQNQ